MGISRKPYRRITALLCGSRRIRYRFAMYRKLCLIANGKEGDVTKRSRALGFFPVSVSSAHAMREEKKFVM